MSSLLERGLVGYHKEDRLYTITDKGMHLLQVYNQLNQLQPSNVLSTATEFQIIEPTQVAKDQSSHLVIYNKERARANHRWKCEKCLRLFKTAKN